MAIYDEIEKQRKLAKEYLVTGDYENAITQAELSLLDLSLIPDGEKEGDAGAKLTWNREAILTFIETVKAKRADAAVSNAGPMGMSVHPIQYQSTRGGRCCG